MMSAYTSGNNAPTLMAQAPNRKGNVSKDPAKLSGGVTTVTRPGGSLMTPSGSQGKADVGKEVTCGRNQKVSVARPAELYDGKAHNTGYLKNSSYLK